MVAKVQGVIAVSALVGALSLSGALAAGCQVKVSGNVALVPTAPNVTVSPLPQRRVHATWQQALRSAKKDWSLRTKQVEVIVRAAVSDDSLYGAGWAVVANLVTPNPAPSNNTVYDKMVIVVSGRSGKVLFSYPADPHRQA